MFIEICNLRNIASLELEIPEEKVSFITGSSGSGKSTIGKAIEGNYDENDVKAGADPASLIVKRTPDEVTVRKFSTDTERSLYTEEVSSGVFDVVMANDGELELAKEEFLKSVSALKEFEQELRNRRRDIDGFLAKTKYKLNKNGAFAKTSMVGAAQSALANSPVAQAELIKERGGQYLSWLLTGVSFPEWVDEKTCPFCCAEAVSDDRVRYLNEVTSSGDVKGFDHIPLLHTGADELGLSIGDLFDAVELDKLAELTKALAEERNSIDELLRFLDAPNTDLRDNTDLLKCINPQDTAFARYDKLPKVLAAAKSSSAAAKKRFGDLKGAFQRTIRRNKDAINEQLSRFDIPYRFELRDLNVGNGTASFFLVHQDSNAPRDYRGKLSYGERNVISLILFLMQPAEPGNLILIDDPVSSYDEYRREQIYKLIINRDDKNTILLLSHDHVFAKYALFHHLRAKTNRAQKRDLSPLEERVLDRTGKVMYLTNIDGRARADEINFNDYDTMANHILTRLQSNDLSYYQIVINLRLFYECQRENEKDKLIYSYLSAILHASREKDLSACQIKLLDQLMDKGICEGVLVQTIEERTGVLLPFFASIGEKDLSETEGFSLIEKIAVLREFEKNKDLKAEMSDIVHMNAALVHCLNPYKYYPCSKRLREKVKRFRPDGYSE